MTLPAAFRRLTEGALGLIYPNTCAACGTGAEPGVQICEECAAQVRKVGTPCCHRCSEPFDGAITGPFTCSNCLGRNYHFECAVAPYRAKGIVREFIHRFKYNRHVELRHTLAEWAAAGLEDDRIRAQAFDALVPVPLHWWRRSMRGFNQARELAELIGKRAGVPVFDLLRRNRHTTSQTTFDRQERMENLRGAFSVRHPAAVQSRHLIIVDDVFTTGSTVDECARVLREAGAASVRALTVARG